MFDVSPVRVNNADLAAQVGKLAALPTRSLADIREQARRYRELERSPDVRDRKRIAHAWCRLRVAQARDGPGSDHDGDPSSPRRRGLCRPR